MHVIGGNPAAIMRGLAPLPARTNYFIGNDPARWRTNVPAFSKVRYENEYPGIDLVFYGHQRTLEYDWVVHPAADPSVIELALTEQALSKSPPRVICWCTTRAVRVLCCSIGRSFTRKSTDGGSRSMLATRLGATGT
jgi:hypothetical protein